MRKYNIFDRIKNIELLILDVDGVMTRGEITYITGDDTARTFDVKDGLGLILFKSHGYKTAVITGKQNELAQRRAAILGIDECFSGFPHKMPAFEQILTKHGLDAAQCAYIGDDLIDLDVMQRVGFAIAVADAHPAVKRAAHYITRSNGGSGAIREITDLFISFKTGEFSCEIPIPDDLVEKWKLDNPLR